MFGREKQKPEDMTDAQMQSSLGMLKNKLKWMNRLFAPAIAFATVGTVVAGVALFATLAGQLLLLGTVAVAAASATTAVVSRREAWQQDIRDLAAENTNRIERAGLALALSDHENAFVSPATVKLKGEFDRALADMRREKDNPITRALRYRSTGPDLDMGF